MGSKVKMVRACYEEMYKMPRCGGMRGQLWMNSREVEVDQKSTKER